MKVSFTALDLKSKIIEHKQKQDEKIRQSLQKTTSRKESIIGTFGLTAALVDWFAAPKITQKIIENTNTKMHPLSVNAMVGFAILGIGLLSGFIFSKIDEKKHTKLGDFAYISSNGPKARGELKKKIDTNA